MSGVVRLLFIGLAAQLSWSPVSATTYRVSAFYNDNSCDGTPYRVIATEDTSCIAQTCSAASSDGSASLLADTDTSSVTCVTNDEYIAEMRTFFNNTNYILQADFSDTGCSLLDTAFGFPATGNCEGSDKDGTYHKKAHLFKNNGSAAINYFADKNCGLDSLAFQETADEETLSNHLCDSSKFKWYSSNDDDAASQNGASSNANILVDNSNSSGTKMGTVVGIAGGSLVVVLVVIVAVVSYRRKSNTKAGGETTAPLHSGGSEAPIDGQTGLWNDNIITARRIPRDKVKLDKLISQGAYGEVYSGLFNSQQVAVKMLLPATRTNLHNVTQFLAEAKMTAQMDHPHVVTFIGVAWDSLSDVCVVLEFMDGGDLRSLLDKYLTSKRPVGVDQEKATIALHVCHALTYLHSLMPAVIHRDLKSRNILLNQALEAKLTDFGISKERLDQTMTVGVGTSLWMAPEVMLGEKYDMKADMFSFGVVLSELDVHTLPYAQAKQSLGSNGRELPHAMLFQKIIAGVVRVDFSESNPHSLVELGTACVSIDPANRPSAAEALYRLQVILAKEL